MGEGGTHFDQRDQEEKKEKDVMEKKKKIRIHPIERGKNLGSSNGLPVGWGKEVGGMTRPDIKRNEREKPLTTAWRRGGKN